MGLTIFSIRECSANDFLTEYLRDATITFLIPVLTFFLCAEKPLSQSHNN